jgi:hypothetical protein
MRVLLAGFTVAARPGRRTVASTSPTPPTTASATSPSPADPSGAVCLCTDVARLCTGLVGEGGVVDVAGVVATVEGGRDRAVVTRSGFARKGPAERDGVGAGFQRVQPCLVRFRVHLGVGLVRVEHESARPGGSQFSDHLTLPRNLDDMQVGQRQILELREQRGAELGALLDRAFVDSCWRWAKRAARCGPRRSCRRPRGSPRRRNAHSSRSSRPSHRCGDPRCGTRTAG